MALRRILLATDFSDASDAAGRTAVALARQCDAELTIVYVVPPVTDPSPSEGIGALAAELAPGLAVKTEVLSGIPTRKIAEYARRQGIDLIVMGSHGRSGLSRALLGSVAEGVVRRGPCPVLVVPFRRRGRRASVQGVTDGPPSRPRALRDPARPPR
jgi:nucleotide-binding universal stress UspA family protein